MYRVYDFNSLTPLFETEDESMALAYSKNKKYIIVKGELIEPIAAPDIEDTYSRLRDVIFELESITDDLDL